MSTPGQRRVAAISSSLQSARPSAADDVVIVSAVRTPICKAKRGAFKDATPDVLLKTVLAEAMQRAGPVAARVGVSPASVQPGAPSD